MIPLDWQVNDAYAGSVQREALGRLPHYLDSTSINPIWQQLQDNSTSGWEPLPPGTPFQLTQDDHLIYSDMPPLAPVAQAAHLGERIFVYPANFVVILQLTGAYSLARVY